MFEWDEKKSELTKQQRSISFEDARKLWECDFCIEIPARTDGEIRTAKIGELFGKVHVCIFTQRGNNIRIISVRRAHQQEEKRYEQEKKTYYNR